MTRRDRLYRWYGTVQRLVVPGLRNSQHRYIELLQQRVAPGSRWLDLGCGHRLLPDWMPDAHAQEAAIIERAGVAVGIDAVHSSLRKHAGLRCRVQGDIEQLPFGHDVFDLATANVVVEHVADPARLLREVHRVLRPGGTFVFHTPNFWGYPTLCAWCLPSWLKIKLVYFLQQRHEQDVFPTCYRLNTPRAIRLAASGSGLRVDRIHHVEHSAQTVMLGPFVAIELLWIRLLRVPMLRPLRPALVAVLRKPG
jgi:ubiquinone/menaquinone biosynthesis C-methylase UbiE